MDRGEQIYLVITKKSGPKIGQRSEFKRIVFDKGRVSIIIAKSLLPGKTN